MSDADLLKSVWRDVKSSKLTVKVLERELRTFKPKPPQRPFYPTDGSPERTRRWFHGYLRRVSRHTYSKAVSAWVKNNRAHFARVLREVRNRVAAPFPKPVLSLHGGVLFPPLSEEDLRYALCIKDPRLPVLEHVKRGAGHPRSGPTHVRHAAIREVVFHVRDEHDRGVWTNMTAGRLYKKKVRTPWSRFGYNWPEVLVSGKTWKNKVQVEINRALKCSCRELDPDTD